MCITNKYGRPSSLCLVPLALVTLLLGGGLVASWVSCYYKCLRGTVVQYNYYAAVWTGGLVRDHAVLKWPAHENSSL